MTKKKILNEVIGRIKKQLVNERKTDELSLQISRIIIDAFKSKEDLEINNIYFEKGDEYASFDLICKFIEDDDFDEPFSVNASADFQEMEIEVTFNPKEFPKSMNDLVAEIKETVEHELEHIEQNNFEYEHIEDEHREEDLNLKYLTSKVEIPAYVRGLIKRAKTKKIKLEDAMDEWAIENKKKFTNFKKDWPKVKNIWMNFAIKMRKNQKVKKFS
jgi:hypothetical protein